MERVAIIGLEFAGLQLALALAKRFPEVVAFDADAGRVRDLRLGVDSQKVVSSSALGTARVRFSSNPADLTASTFFVVAPVGTNGRPDLSPVERAAALVGRALSAGAVVVFEGACFPGFTEEVCGPLLERESGMKRGVDFKIGYSPERANSGDEDHTLEKVTKVVSGEDAETVERVAAVYAAVVSAGVHRAASIRVAEAAKVLENTQRDVNVALMNELATIFDKAGISTRDVLAVAGSKWNFAPFRPGLLGGDGAADRHYLAMSAQKVGYQSEVLLAGRRINDRAPQYVAEKLVKLLIGANRRLKGARVGVLGLTSKKNVNDIRNTKVAEVIRELRQFGIAPLVHDPLVTPSEAVKLHDVRLTSMAEFVGLDALLLAVCHDAYADLGADRLTAMVTDGGVLAQIGGDIDWGVVPRGIHSWGF